MAQDREETWSEDSVLAQRIWERYASSPGVISTASALQLSGRIAGAGRLPLLADVQRRWLSSNEIWPRGGSTLLYARPASYAESLSPTPVVGAQPPMPASAESRLPRARITAPSVSSAGRVVQRERSPSVLTADRPPGEARASPLQVRTPRQAGGDVNATAPAAAEIDSLGAAIVQRHRDASVAQVAQIVRRGVVEPFPEQAARVRTSDAEGITAAGRPLFRQSSRPAHKPRSTEARTESALPAAEGELGAAIVQRYRGTPIKRVARARVADGGLMRLSEPVGSSSGRGAQEQRASADRASAADHPLLERPSRPTGESRSPAAQAGSVTPAGGAPVASPGPLDSSSGHGGRVQRVATEVKSAMSAGSEIAQTKPVMPAVGGGDLGAAILQRHLSGPVGHVAQTMLALSGAASDHPLVGPSSSRPEFEAGPRTIAARPAMRDISASDLGATLLQRYLDGPVGRAEERRRLTAVPGPTGVAWQGVPGLQRLSAGSAQSFPDLAVRQGAASAPLFGQNAFEPLAGLASGQVEMPLARAAGGGSVPPVQLRPAASGTQASVVQRPTAEITAGPGADVLAGESTLPGETRSGAEGPDVERLADEVYAIIERRLIIERESRGL